MKDLLPLPFDKRCSTSDFDDDDLQSEIWIEIECSRLLPGKTTTS